ncbi:MAG: UrcA family protein [Sphingomonadales bacterium]
MGNLSPRLHGSLSLVLVAGGLLSVNSPAYAQEEITGPTITITAPRRVVVERSSSGVPIELISLSAIVGYGDLDLRTPASRAELDKRVTEAARDACKELDAKFPGGTTDVSTCAKDARAKAQGQIDAAIAAATQ